MALPNGVLVHGPNGWACAIRHPDGRLEVASAREALPRCECAQPVPARPGPPRGGARDPAGGEARAARRDPADAEPARRRLDVRRRVRRAGDPRVVPAAARGPGADLRPARARACSVRAARLRARRLSRRGAHLDRHATSTASARRREHERCGGHLLGPLVATTAVGNVLAGLAPERVRNHARAAAQVGALAASTEIFGWMTRHPDTPRRAGAVEAGPRAPAPVLDRRADAGAARGRRGGARRVPRARAWRRLGRREHGCRPSSSTCRSRRCAPAGTRTHTSTTPARHC